MVKFPTLSGSGIETKCSIWRQRFDMIVFHGADSEVIASVEVEVRNQRPPQDDDEAVSAAAAETWLD